MILSWENGQQLLRDKKFIILYGIGFYGTICEQILKQKEIDITCYAISDGQPKSSTFKGKEIKFISDIQYPPDSTVFVLTLNEKFWIDIKKLLEEKGYYYILEFDSTIIPEYMEKYFKEIMDKKKINIEKKILDFGILKINNPLSNLFREIFIREACDLILPYFGEDVFICEGTYEIENIGVLSNDIVIDCGANIGVFSTFAAQKGREVFAFEPVLETREYLARNAELYPGKIHVEPYAVSDKNGETTMFITENSGGNSLLSEHINETGQITVPTITLDQFVKERNLPRVDFIKADIEGAERLMLAGAQETLQRFAPKLAICTYHLPDDKEVLEGLIKQANPDYIVTHRWKKLYAYVQEEKRQLTLKENATWHEEV